MHDRTGNELKIGDKVILLGEITQISATEEFCNVALKSTYGRRPDGQKETVMGINTAVLDKVS
jgi:hypothetical protein